LIDTWPKAFIELCRRTRQAILAGEKTTAAADRDMACGLDGQIPQTALQLHNIRR